MASIESGEKTRGRPLPVLGSANSCLQGSAQSRHRRADKLAKSRVAPERQLHTQKVDKLPAAAAQRLPAVGPLQSLESLAHFTIPPAPLLGGGISAFAISAYLQPELNLAVEPLEKEADKGRSATTSFAGTERKPSFLSVGTAPPQLDLSPTTMSSAGLQDRASRVAVLGGSRSSTLKKPMYIDATPAPSPLERWQG